MDALFGFQTLRLDLINIDIPVITNQTVESSNLHPRLLKLPQEQRRIDPNELT